MAKIYRYWQDGHNTILDATDADVAYEEAHDLAREGWEPCDTTSWVHGALQASDDDDGESWYDVGDVVTQIDPEEPPCEGRRHRSHRYEETGLRGNGGGVVIHETCSRCGLVQVTDTWATDPYNGTRGHDSVKYIQPDTV